jgi:hypothetical protein
MTAVRRGSLLVALLAASACAATRVSVEARPDGALHLTCRAALPDCLVEAERRCQGRHYVVLRAVDEHDHRGGPELNVDARTSEALVRCGPLIGWPAGFDPMTAPTEAVAPQAPPPSGARLCVPGTTQACVGPGGCGGGQACLPDGGGFGACDCGGDASGVGRGQ